MPSGQEELDISAINPGALAFELGSDTTAGTTYDQIRLTSGSLAIGSALLNFDDFSFTALSGFGEGTYTLFQTVGITGTLGSSLTGFISGNSATLSLSGNNVLLNVVPEPSTLATLLFGGLALLGGRLRRRHRKI